MRRKKSVSKKIKKILKRITKITLAVSIIMSSKVYASAAGQPAIVTNSIRLITDATGWLMLLIPLVAALMVGFWSFQKSMSDDQAQTADLNKKIKTTIISGAIGVSASGLVNFILGYFS